MLHHALLHRLKLLQAVYFHILILQAIAVPPVSEHQSIVSSTPTVEIGIKIFPNLKRISADMLLSPSEHVAKSKTYKKREWLFDKEDDFG